MQLSFPSLKRRIRKFRRHPERFLSDSQSKPLQALGDFLKSRPKLAERVRAIAYAPQDYLPAHSVLPWASGWKPDADVTLDVIIPCYNNAGTVEAAILSVLRQTVPATTVIVVDDGSADESCRIVQRLCDTDGRVRLHALKENRGVSYARNLGLKHAQSRFVAFQDADDISHPRRFEMQLRHLMRSDAVAVTSDGCRVVEGKAVELDGHYYHELSISVLFQRQAVLQAIGFMRPMTIGEDVDYLFRMKAAFGEERVGHLWRCLYFAAMRQGSVIHAHGEMREIEAGRYVYIPGKETQSNLDQIAVWNADPSNLFVPFPMAGLQRQSNVAPT